MTNIKWRIGTLILLLAALTGCESNSNAADTLYTNGKFYTVNAQAPWASVMAIKGNDIIYIGDSDGAKAYTGNNTQITDLEGKFVMPGFIATHEHSIFYMAVNSALLAELTHDEEKVLAEVEAYVKSHPDGPYFGFGGGYESSIKLHRDQLDAITGDKPFFLMSGTGHAGWANSKALELAGVTEDSEPIDFFEKDPDGRRNGYVGTSAAAYYMMGLAGLHKDAVIKASKDVLETFRQHGITHVLEAGQPPGHEENLFAAIGELEDSGKLTTRYTVACMIQRAHQIDTALNCLDTYSKQYNSEMFRVNTLKIHGDGSIEGHTANILEPYADREDTTGILSMP